MILVTGGAGFIGSHIVDALVAEGHEPRVLDASAPNDSRSDVEFIRGDVADPDAVASALRGIDAVCHQAAMVGLGQDMLDIADYARHNDLGTAVLLRELAAGGFDGRLVLASSMVVYGEGRISLCAARDRTGPAPGAREPDIRPLRSEMPLLRPDPGPDGHR